MHLFSPERPEISTNVKSLLIDGSAVPNIMCRPLENGLIELSVMLRHYDDRGGYGYRHANVSLAEVSVFFAYFVTNPENCLEAYFDWKPSAKPTAKTKEEVEAIYQSVEDLL